MAISFKGVHVPKEVILIGVRWYVGAGCEYSRVHTLRTLVIVEAKSGNRVWGRQQYTRHAAAACRRECA